MKNKLRQSFLVVWQILTEVPGWPDAPKKLRLRRLIPGIIPVATMILLYGWNQFWTQPRIRAERESCNHLLALEQEVADLQFAGSETLATETSERAAEADRRLLSNSKLLAVTLEKLTQTARAQGWEAIFHALPVPAAPPASETPLFFVNARGKLSPATNNPQPFASLLTFLDQFPPPNRSIDLTRLTIRADEQGRQTAEILIRAGCRATE